MDMMLLGELIRAEAAGTVCAGHWMAAKGNDGVAGLETFYVSATGFTVVLQTKKSDEADSAAVDIGSGTVGTTPGVVKFDVNDAKDLVRYAISASTGGIWMHAQFLQPMWAPN
ncbi:MAG: hypothetical protein IPK26_27940 [Planctomycetes bacterium]|nr:hypothetical protein [Planctomycetota bacterium]